MLVIIPTFKRLDSLKWVVKSLLRANLPDLTEKPRLYLVNNFPPNNVLIKDFFNEIVDSYSGADRWHIGLLQRENTLLPIDNWYSAIHDLSKENEIVFLHGDDDLFCQNDLRDRYNALNNENGDIFISPFFDGLTFIDSEYVQIDNFPDKFSRNKKFSYIVDRKKFFYTTPFISAQVFRFNNLFRESFQLCKNWIDAQEWAPYSQTSLMLPYYLPIAINFLNGKVLFTDQKFIIRGSNFEEAIKAPFTVPGWNSGFLHFFALDILRNRDLGKIVELNPHRNEIESYISEWYFTFFFDNRLSKNLVLKTLLKVKIKVNFYGFLKSLKLVIKELIGRKCVVIQNRVRKGEGVIETKILLNHV